MAPSETPWLVIPTYNEAENLESLIRAAMTVLQAAAPEGFTILVVDDGSPDGTGELADRLAAELDAVRVLHRPAKGGLGPAYLAGFASAIAGGAGYVMEMDADFSHDPADLSRLLAAARDGADLVLGSRYVPGGGVIDWGVLRRLVSRAGSLYARLLLSVHVHDLTGGFKCFRRATLQAIDFPSVRSQGYAFQIELTYRAARCGFEVVELPIVFRERQVGRSKMSSRIALEAFWRVPQMRLRRRA
ncbi:MAG: polyprenol monophosphomannose synthase [Actinomycetota bacterium]|nr:polyprenol monophosphomannose synthase [Actinomycetota bacterium]